MLKIFAESYIFLAYLLLHITFFACDTTCIFSINRIADKFPSYIQIYSRDILRYLHVSHFQGQIIAQILFLGNLAMIILSIIKLLAYVIRRFFVVTIVIALAICLLNLFSFK